MIGDPKENAVWVSTSAVSRLFRLDSDSKRVTRLDCGITPKSGTQTFVIGPDRKIWFTEPLGGRIARLDEK